MPGQEQEPVERPQGRTITLVLHGTFAAADRWWRLGEGGTFADRLEAALRARGRGGTVWRPALDQGYGYGDFSWSGANDHRARRGGAKTLAASINGLAVKLGATETEPLTLNVVAHSHGGNVFLEALRHLDASVALGRCVMLGTPLISFRPAFRLGRLALANILLGFLFLFGFFLLVQLLHLAFACGADLLGAGLECGFMQADEGNGEDPEFSGGMATLLIAPIIVFYGWLFWAFAFAGDVVWILLFMPLVWLFGRAAGQAYGPSPAVLAERLGIDGQGQKRIVLFTSHFDEAELLLQLGAAPNQLYRDYLARHWNAVFRIAERVALRPMVDGIFLKTIETVLERFVFGIPWRMVLCFDYAVADVEKGRAYPRSLFEQIRLADHTLSVGSPEEIQSIEEGAADEADEALPEPLETQAPTLFAALRVIAGDIRAQIKLRHSRYYQSEAVIDRVADALCGRDRLPRPAAARG